MSEMKAFNELCETATQGLWLRDGTFLYTTGEEGANIAAASELYASETVQYNPPSVGSPNLKEIFANAKLLALSRNYVERLVKNLVTVTERLEDGLETEGLLEHEWSASDRVLCATIRTLLAEIEEAAKGTK